MKIFLVIDGPPYPYAIGGTETFVHSLAVSFSKKSHEVTIIGKMPHLWTRSSNNGLSDMKSPHEYKVLLLKRSRTSVMRPFDYVIGWRALKGRLNAGDAVFTFMGHSSLLGYIVSKLVDPTVTTVTFTGSDVRILVDKYFFSPIDIVSYFHIKLGLSFLSRRGLIIAISRRMKEKLSERHPSKRILVIPVGVDDRFYTDPTKRESGDIKRILFAGRLENIKNVGKLLDAFKIATRNHKNVVLEIAGGGSLMGELKTRVKRDPSLLKKVKFLGWVPYERMHEFFKGGYMLVLPSLSEGLPLTVLQAMASGLPIVATSVGGIPEVVHNGYNGILVPPGSTRKLAEAIDFLLTYEEESIKFGERSREIAEKYRMERVSKLYEDLILSVK